MRRIVTTLFVVLILGEVVASPFFCLKCCPSQEQGADDHEACSPWCVACTCCHSTQTVSPEAPPVPVVLAIRQVETREVSILLPITPPREILHVPLA